MTEDLERLDGGKNRRSELWLGFMSIVRDVYLTDEEEGIREARRYTKWFKKKKKIRREL